MNYVFHNQQLVHQYDVYSNETPTLDGMLKHCPLGAYIYNGVWKNWYRVTSHSSWTGFTTPVPTECVPNWAKVLQFLIT